MYNGHQVKILLTLQDVSAATLAKQIYGNNRRSLHNLIYGNPSVEIIEKVADFFHVPIDTFFVRSVDVNEDAPSGELDKTYINLLIAAKDDTIKKQEEQISILRSENKSLKRQLKAGQK